MNLLSAGGCRSKCNSTDITRFKGYAQRLDLYYNNEFTPLTIGDYRMNRWKIGEPGGNEGGLESWVNYAEGLAYTSPVSEILKENNQRSAWTDLASLVFTKQVESADYVHVLINYLLAELSKDVTLPWKYRIQIWNALHDISYNANPLALPVNLSDLAGVVRHKYSYPWLYAPGTEGGDDAGDYQIMFGHASNMLFGTVAYYALEFKGTADEFFQHLKNKFIPAGENALWFSTNI